MDNANTFILADHVFKIDTDKCYIRETLEEDYGYYTFWDIWIDTIEDEFEGFKFKPNIRGDKIIVPEYSIINCENKNLDLDAGFRADSEDVAFSIYFAEHSDTHHNKISFYDITNNKVKIKWSGLCDLYYSEKYRKNVPFEINCELKIKESVSVDEFISPSLFIEDKLNNFDSFDEDEQEEAFDYFEEILEENYLTEEILLRFTDFLYSKIRQKDDLYEACISILYVFLSNNRIDEKSKQVNRFKEISDKEIDEIIQRVNDERD